MFCTAVVHDNVLYCSTWCMILSRSWEVTRWNYLQRNTSLVLFSFTSILSTCTSSFCHLTATPANNRPVQVINSFLYAEIFCSHSLNGKIELNENDHIKCYYFLLYFARESCILWTDVGCNASWCIIRTFCTLSGLITHFSCFILWNNPTGFMFLTESYTALICCDFGNCRNSCQS